MRKLPRGLALLARVARLRLKGTIDDQRVDSFPANLCISEGKHEREAVDTAAGDSRPIGW